MSTTKVINVIHPSGVTNNIVNDSSGNVTVGNNLTVTGTVTATGGFVGAGINVQTFTSSGTWTKPSGYAAGSRVLVQAWGGGASGGKDSTANYAGGGGGGGCYAEIWFTLSSLGATESVTIGAGGAAVSSNGAGNVGGTTSFGTKAYAYGGGAGGGSTQTYTGGGGGGMFGAGSDNVQGLPFNTTALQLAGRGAAAGANAASGLWSGGGGGGVNNAANTNGGNGGACYWGGGGGGGAASGSGVAGTGGASYQAGAGGAGGATGTAGTQPAGGGGGSTSGNSGKGGDDQVIITVFPA